jgi:hypothetical protein
MQDQLVRETYKKEAQMIKEAFLKDQRKQFVKKYNLMNNTHAQMNMNSFRRELQDQINRQNDADEMQYREDMFQNRDQNVANHFYGNAKREKEYYETMKQLEML